MDGVKFSEIPLLAGANNNLRKQAQQKLNNDYSYSAYMPWVLTHGL